jgi:hypothetical protein
MATVIFTIIELAISVGIVVAACVFTALARFMPYVTGLFASILVYFTQDWTKKMIPGHPWMNFITVLVAIELIVLLFTHLPKVGKAVIFALSELFIAIIGGMIFMSLKPDSVGYCVFATAVYAALTAFFLITNISIYDLDDYDFEELGVVTRIITGIIYTASGYFLIAMPAEMMWQKYFDSIGTGAGFAAVYLLIRIALFITAGLVVTVSIIRDKDTIDLLA